MTETMVDVKVTYSLTFEGKVYIVEHVPARVSKETGEQYFAPDTWSTSRLSSRAIRDPTRL